MIYQMYSVFDNKVGAFLQPFFMRSNGEATRAFIELLLDPKSSFSKYKGDYDLFHLGHFDDTSGRLSSLDILLPLGNGIVLASAEQ